MCKKLEFSFYNTCLLFFFYCKAFRKKLIFENDENDSRPLNVSSLEDNVDSKAIETDSKESKVTRKTRS